MTVADTPRKLTVVEIDDVASVIPPVQAGTIDIAEENYGRIVEMTKRQLAEIDIKPSKIEKLKATIYNRCMRARVHPGDNVGLHASESMGQPISQINLNTFHKSGASGQAGGINDFKKVFALPKTNLNDRTTLFMSDLDVGIEDMMNISKAFIRIPITKLLRNNDITSIETVRAPPGGFSDRTVFGKHYELFERFTSLDESRYEVFKQVKQSVPGSSFVRINLDRYQLFYNRISTKEIAIAIEKIDNVFCVFSPTKDAVVDVFVYSPTDGGGGGDEGLEEFVLPDDDVSEDASVDEDEDRDEEPARVAGVRAKKQDEDGASSTSSSSEGNEVVEGASFLHDVLVPILNEGDNIFVKPMIILKGLERLSDEFDSFGFASENNEIPNFGSHRLINFDSIVNYASSEYDYFNVLSAFKGETVKPLETLGEERPGFEIWNIWVNRYLLNVNGTRFSTMVKIVKLAFEGVAGFKFLTAPDLEDDGVDSMAIIVPTSIKSPLAHIKAKVKEGEPKQIQVCDQAKFFRPPSKGSELARLATRYYLKLYDSASHTLKTLHAIPIFDRKYSFINSFHELYDIFGIEGARSIIITEIYSLFKSVDSYINPVHIRLTADVMTTNGTLMPIAARGVANKHLGAYYDSSFEQALKSFQKAAIWGNEETVKTASSSVLFGTRCRFGTGAFKMRPTIGDERPEEVSPPLPLQPPMPAPTTSDESTIVNVNQLFGSVFPPAGGVPSQFYKRGVSPLLI